MAAAETQCIKRGRVRRRKIARRKIACSRASRPPRIFASAMYIYMYTCVRVAIYVHIRSVKIIFYFEIARPGSNPSIMSHAMNIIAMQKHRAEAAHLSLSLDASLFLSLPLSLGTLQHSATNRSRNPRYAASTLYLEATALVARSRLPWRCTASSFMQSSSTAPWQP